MKRKNIKILLINPPFFRLVGVEHVYIPMGICSLAAVTKKAGYETFVYNMDVPPMESELFSNYQEKFKLSDERDLILANLENDPLNVWRELDEVLEDIKPDVIGITAQTGQIPTAFKVAEICKRKDPYGIIIAGGAHPTVRPNDLLEKQSFDYVFRGEADDAILDFLSAFSSGLKESSLRSISGLSYRSQGDILHNPIKPLADTLDDYPVPLRESFVFPERWEAKNMGFVLSSRGCPFKCHFCASATLYPRKVRFRTIEHVITEVEYLIKKFNTYEFMFLDDTFIANKERANQFCNALKIRGLNIKWRCTTRIDNLTEELLDLIISHGCKQINIGIESGSQRIQRYINKNLNLEIVAEKMDLLRSKKIAWSANFIIGYPEETIADIEETMFFVENKVRNHIALGVCIPFPGTKFFEDCISLGIIDDRKPIDWTLFLPQTKYACFSKYVSCSQLNYYVREIIKKAEPYMRVRSPDSFSLCERSKGGGLYHRVSFERSLETE